jgi:oxygen-independent coproporphyrinogen-3 oxidase
MIRVAIEQAKGDTAPVPLGLYVHVPFCASTCDFCAFYQTVPTADAIDRYLEAITREMDLVEWSRPAATVFWGGGTPGLLAAKDLARLGELVRARGGGQPVEWTVELAPGSVTDARLAALKDVGVTRISMGVQSFQPALLEALGRRHSLTQIHRAYERIRRAEFHSVNLDLMFALPGQTAEEWERDLAAAVALAPDHLSTYCLTFEEDAKLWVQLSQGRVKLDPDREADLYRQTWRSLAEKGYAQYEVSNFARPGHACLHNLNTWRMCEWIGLGPSAASQHAGLRGSNIADLEAWLRHVADGRRVTEDRVTLSPELIAEDGLIFGLRMNDGIDLAAWETRAPAAPWQVVRAKLDELVLHGFAERDANRVYLTDAGRLMADAIGTELMMAFDRTTSGV